MGAGHSLWTYFYNAGPLVKLVMMMLLSASVASWTFIYQRWTYYSQIRKSCDHFLDRFWSGTNLAKLYNEVVTREEDDGIASIFVAGYKEFMRVQAQGPRAESMMDSVQRQMRIAQAHEQSELEKHLSFLASVGSSSPYVGLFGTVWGIMTALQALGNVQQASISMVAPGISEALVATAMGLFAAIPAQLAYNRFVAQLDSIINEQQTFQEEFFSVLQAQANGGPQRV
jgi:biopolymer transport protein TolQ